MSTRRTITIELTSAQFEALAGAVATAANEIVCAELPDGAQQVATLDRAWEKINTAWYGRERKGGKR